MYISLYGLHGDPQYFDEPEVFNPERFGDGKTISPAYIPFGEGPRKCIGKSFYWLRISTVPIEFGWKSANEKGKQ